MPRPLRPISDGLIYHVIDRGNNRQLAFQLHVALDRRGMPQQSVIRLVVDRLFPHHAAIGAVVGVAQAKPLKRAGADSGLTLIASRRLPGVELVYNLTVEGQHVYQQNWTRSSPFQTSCVPWYVVSSQKKSIKPFQLFVVGKAGNLFTHDRRQLEWLQNVNLANPARSVQPS